MTSTSTAGAVRQGSLRELNLAVVLRRIAAADRPPSRAGIAADTGLTRATVSAVVDDLIAGRLVAEAEPEPRTGAAVRPEAWCSPPTARPGSAWRSTSTTWRPASST
ncbi:hypothetical protein V2I01_06050 [Micromonospora sp. BRA006-A]|nr:hypothetical protein [Micromonospora sp. BRA006-A]